MRDAAAPEMQPQPTTAEQRRNQPVHLATQTPGRDGGAGEFALDAKEFVNKFCPRLLDANPAFVAVPEAEDDSSTDDSQNWTKRPGPPAAVGVAQAPPRPSPSASLSTAIASLPPLPPGNVLTTSWAPVGAGVPAGFKPLGLPMTITVPKDATAEQTSLAAMETLKEAMATAGAIAKLGSKGNPGEAGGLSHSEIVRGWDRALASGAVEGMSRESRVIGVGLSGGAGDGGVGARSEMQGRLGEAMREAADWEKKVNSRVRANRKAAGY